MVCTYEIGKMVLTQRYLISKTMNKPVRLLLTKLRSVKLQKIVISPKQKA